MLCEKCQKREAVVHVTEVVAGAPDEMKKHNFCEPCFAESQLSKVLKTRKTAGWTSYNPTQPIPPDDESSR